MLLCRLQIISYDQHGSFWNNETSIIYQLINLFITDTQRDGSKVLPTPTSPCARCGRTVTQCRDDSSECPPPATVSAVSPALHPGNLGLHYLQTGFSNIGGWTSGQEEKISYTICSWGHKYELWTLNKALARVSFCLSFHHVTEQSESQHLHFNFSPQCSTATPRWDNKMATRSI